MKKLLIGQLETYRGLRVFQKSLSSSSFMEKLGSWDMKTTSHGSLGVTPQIILHARLAGAQWQLQTTKSDVVCHGMHVWVTKGWVQPTLERPCWTWWIIGQSNRLNSEPFVWEEMESWPTLFWSMTYCKSCFLKINSHSNFDTVKTLVI